MQLLSSEKKNPKTQSNVIIMKSHKRVYLKCSELGGKFLSVKYFLILLEILEKAVALGP